MKPPSIEQLRYEISRVRRRRNVILHVRQIGWRLAGLLALFILCGFLEMVFHPSAPARIFFFCLFGVATGAVGWGYLRAVQRFSSDDKRLAQYVDDHTPDLEQRLITAMDYWEKQGEKTPSQLVESLWQDTAARVRDRNIQQVTTAGPAWFAAGSAMVLICLLTVALWDSTRFAGAARRVIWPWSLPAAAIDPSAALQVVPGDILIRRGSDVTVVARIENAPSGEVFLHLQAQAADWKRIRMQAEDSEREFMHYLSAVTTDTTYFVDIGTRRSRQYRIRVFDLPRIETIDVAYVYPAHTGMKNKTEKDAGDIIAPEGTGVRLHIAFNRPIQKGTLKFEDGSTIDLTPEANFATGAFVVAGDGTYTVDAVDSEGRKIENPMEYLIRSIPDSPPEVSVTMPGRDLKVMALEEVTINAAAKDDFGLTNFALNYSIAGGDEQNVYFLDGAKQQGSPAIDASSIIYLEDLQLAPGDFVAYYLTAADNNGVAGPSEVISDIYFLEVINTDEEFRRASAQGGGGGQSGQGRPQSALVENQKNIIAATWKLLNRQKKMPTDKFSEEVKVVAQSQREVAQRAQMSLNRLSERFSFADESYDQAIAHLFEAVMHMQAAAEKLFSENLKEALGPEQAALQAILKAESKSRRTDIQTARNRGGSGGGSDQNREREDLRELFEMEMGRLENRYEMPAAAAGRAAAGQEDVLKRLRELAHRQERLNRAQVDADRRKNRMTQEQQRRHLEQLRREQEALSRQAEALSQKWSRRAGDNRTRSSMRSLERAVDQMREAARNLGRQDAGGAAASGREALQNLRDQQQLAQRRQATSVFDLIKELDEKAAQLQLQEKEILEKMEGLRADNSSQLAREARRSSQSAPDSVTDIIVKKDRLQDELAETEETIWAISARGRQSQPEIARKAMEALRSLESEGIDQRIEESKDGLQDGRLNLAMEMEKEIEQSINRFSSRLQDFNLLVPKTGPERIEQAADRAAALSRELENLRRQVEASRSNQRDSVRARGDGRTQDLNRLRDGLARSRRYAQGLSQSGAQGDDWAVDARSIYRELTRKQIEDFMYQPDLWRALLEPARELASALRAQAEANRIKDNPFSPSEQAPPAQYEAQVETYYRSLSEKTEHKN
jgi:hypothetical protein